MDINLKNFCVYRYAEGRKYLSFRMPEGLLPQEALAWCKEEEKKEGGCFYLRHDLCVAEAKSLLFGTTYVPWREVVARHLLGRAELALYRASKKAASQLRQSRWDNEYEGIVDPQLNRDERRLWREARHHYQAAKRLGMVPGVDMDTRKGW